jgi:hypothetical protein
MSPDHDPLLDSQAELAFWPAIGRSARGGSWSRQAETTLQRIEAALADGRRDDAAGLVRHLVVEAAEIHELLSEWCARIPAILRRAGVAAERITELDTQARVGAGEVDHDACWRRFVTTASESADAILAGTAGDEAVQATVARWLEGHDSHLLLTAAWVDAVVTELGEAKLGELWAELQQQPIDSYKRYDTTRSPWPDSFALLVQIALEGMHAHFGGPKRRGEIELIEHDDRVEMRFDPCGSGGRIRRDELFGVTREPHPFAWNRVGVCHYCIHCCVLQQLEPIRRMGYPARVIEPPTEPGMPCSWTVYRDPALVPDSAYIAVGARPPERRGVDDGAA